MASIAALGLMSLGTVSQYLGNREASKTARAQAKMARVRAEFDAWQAEEDSKESIAIAQREAMEERRQSDIVASRALAVAAASGGGVSDPTIVNLIARIKGEGAYRAAVAMYEGESRARQYRLAAASSRYGGAQAQLEGARQQVGYAYRNLGLVFESGASLYARYGIPNKNKDTV